MTGDSDGAQHLIGNSANFRVAIGLLVPPYATLTVSWERQAKTAKSTTEELLTQYETDYATTVDKMIAQLTSHLTLAAS